MKEGIWFLDEGWKLFRSKWNARINDIPHRSRLTYSQYKILAALAEKPMPQNTVCGVTLVDRATTAAILVKLAKSKLVEKHKSLDNLREVTWSTTRKGDSLVELHNPIYELVLSEINEWIDNYEREDS